MNYSTLQVTEKIDNYDFSITEKYSKLKSVNRLPIVKIDLTHTKFQPLDIYITEHCSFFPIDWNTIPEETKDELFDKNILGANTSSRFTTPESVQYIEDMEAELILPITADYRYDYDNLYLLIMESPITNLHRDQFAEELHKHKLDSSYPIGIREIVRVHYDEDNVETVKSFFN